MEEQHLTDLIGKYLAGKATDSEKKELNDWYSQQNEREAVWESDVDNEEKRVEARMLRQINAHVQSTRTRVFYFNKRFIRGAAAVFAGFFLLSGIYFLVAPRHSGNKNLVAASVSAPVKFSENKYVKLPDGSIVVLHSGSKIQYNFNGKVRELSLFGEAYFDIKHKTDQPFVIHTGNLTTTVLGTAFNIVAFPGQNITVSVTRGKVSVADKNKKIVAVLLPNQQVTYSDVTKMGNLQIVKAKEVITWTKSDMQLDDIPFKQVAERLSRRYSVEVKFKNPDLEKCLIHGRFDGTESLQQVLDVLTRTIGASYTIDGQNIMIDGTACQ
ncbi:DUF4974 domain-containing protein [Mucilaginibacter sp. KACC 22773]|uniref:FecR family protein n=1 Tax=Mucilaginibacter sp. KACC 22773 TaxID=3025671 RepID=UPI002365E056|nr:FecR domain-containing protein [Mucilaginibacter sp. KACC 22773]WDF77175.1 DUF4974 domain-containing protein [Mucilaginibacter sp. KACC 22773]